MRHVILTPVENGWVAEVPSLPGCITEADTREEALEYIKEAIEAYLLTLQDYGEPVPDDVAVELATVRPDCPATCPPSIVLRRWRRPVSRGNVRLAATS